MKAWKEINGEKPYVIPTLYDNGTIGGSTFACACQTNSSSAYYFFEGYLDSLSLYGSYIEWYYPMSVGCLVTALQIEFSGPVTASGRLQAYINNSRFITVGSFYISYTSGSSTANIIFEGVQYYSQRYRLLFDSCSPSDRSIMLNSITQKTLVDAYKMVKQENVRKYYKYQYETFTRPNLTADGVIGGGSFAVQTSGYVSGYQAYKAVDGNNSTGWECSNYANDAYIFYNPIPLKLTSIKMRNWTGSGRKDSTKGGKVYGSNNGEDWTELVTYTNSDYSSGAEWYISMTSVSSAYKYYKITCTDGTSDSGNYWNIAEMTPIGSEQTVIAGTSSDYDFYKDETVYSAFNI